MTDPPYEDGNMVEQRWLVVCPTCKATLDINERPSPLSVWDGEGYTFSCCGAHHHLDYANGGAKNWLEQ